MMSVEQSVEYLAGETVVLGENMARVPPHQPQIPYDLARALTRAAAVRSRRLTTRPTAQPAHNLRLFCQTRRL
jgi:hypothetical protein